ncbi:MAG: sialate O-acetylesterase [Planctomycetota bacterium]
MTMQCNAQPELPDIFADGMVLQREQVVPVWGWSEPGTTVQVAASWGNDARAIADETGRWQTGLQTPEAGGPFELLITDSSGDTRIKDVLIGEVWIASGQSNMHMRVQPVGHHLGALNWQRDVAVSDDDELRIFDVPQTIALSPQRQSGGEWTAASTATTGNFSATAYFFAHHLRERLGVPVGVITSDWGGTRAEAWTPLEDLALRKQSPRLRAAATEMMALRDRGGSSPNLVQQLRDEWWSNAIGAQPPEAAETASWDTAAVPGVWEQSGLAGFDGVAWLIRTIELPADFVGKQVTLSLGPIDDQDRTFVNGSLVGETTEPGAWNTPRVYTVPADVNTSQRMTIAIAVLDTASAGGMHGTAAQLYVERADGLGSRVSLAGVWQRKAEKRLSELPKLAGQSQHDAGVLYHGMMTPIVPYAAKGFLWYQGESNRFDPDEYSALLRTMIAGWRREWRSPNAPFLIVQIAPFGYRPDPDDATARLREAQRDALQLPDTALVVTSDVGDEGDIHPRQKREVGERLALAALHLAYGMEDESALSPQPRRAEQCDDEIHVSFDFTGGELRGPEALLGFETYDGTDWTPARAGIDADRIVIQATAAVQSVRYLWSAYHEADVFDARGLPLGPFLIDVDRP